MDRDWQPFRECARYITQRSKTGEYRWCHRFDWPKDGRMAAYGGGSVVADETGPANWESGMAPGHEHQQSG